MLGVIKIHQAKVPFAEPAGRRQLDIALCPCTPASCGFDVSDLTNWYRGGKRGFDVRPATVAHSMPRTQRLA